MQLFSPAMGPTTATGVACNPKRRYVVFQTAAVPTTGPSPYELAELVVRTSMHQAQKVFASHGDRFMESCKPYAVTPSGLLFIQEKLGFDSAQNLILSEQLEAHSPDRAGDVVQIAASHALLAKISSSHNPFIFVVLEPGAAPYLYLSAEAGLGHMESHLSAWLNTQWRHTVFQELALWASAVTFYAMFCLDENTHQDNGERRIAFLKAAAAVGGMGAYKTFVRMRRIWPALCHEDPGYTRMLERYFGRHVAGLTLESLPLTYRLRHPHN